jgi:predicted porin
MLVAGAVSGAVYAQTNVTLYGRLDVVYAYSKSDYKKFQGIEQGMSSNSGSSFVGIRGEEALGNGLKAVFNYQWAINPDNFGTTGYNRVAYVGLAGGFGQVVVGTQSTPADMYMGGTSAFGVNGAEPADLMRTGNNFKRDSRWGNAVSYVSPNFSGLDFSALYSFGEKVNTSKRANGGYDCTKDTYKVDPNTGLMVVDQPAACYNGADTSDAGRLGLGVRYSNGPLYLTAVYHAQANDDGQKPYTGASKAGYGWKGWAIGGAYDFKVVKVFANYYREKANSGGLGGSNNGSDKISSWAVGLSVPVSSAGTILAEYGQHKDYLDNRGGLTPAALGGRPGHKAKGYTLGYKHDLSKRTYLNAYVTRVDNDRGINVGWGKTGVAGEKQTTFVTGIVHNF